MKKSKKLVALIASAAMLCTFNPTAVSPFVSAEEVTNQAGVVDLSEWMPQNYDEAIEFYNKYGQTYIDGGLICTVQLKWNSYFAYETKQSGTAEYVVLSNEEYFSDEYGGYTYEVTLYRATGSGDINLSWIDKNPDNDKIVKQTDFSFYVNDNLGITQTDIYSWAPDSIEEYEEFYDNHGMASIYNGYVVYCNDISGSAGFSLIADQTGTGRLETVLDYTVMAAEEILLVGGATHNVIIYEPSMAGEVEMKWTHGRLWELDAEYTQITVQNYLVNTDLSVSNEYNNGDCNLDGEVRVISDVVALKKYLTRETKDYDVFSPQNADLNNDGKINVFDFILIKRDFSYPTGLPDIENHLEFTVQNEESIKSNRHKMTFRAFIANSAEEIHSIVEENEGSDVTVDEIDDSVFNDKAAVVLYASSDVINRQTIVDDIFVENHHTLVIETITSYGGYKTPGITYNRIVLLIDKNAVEDITKTAVRNINISES